MKIARRRLLQNAALFGALWPAFGRTRRALADVTVPRRVVIVFSPNGPQHVRGPAEAVGDGFALHDWWSPLERHRSSGAFFAGCMQAGVPYGEHNEYGHQSGGTGALTARTTEGTNHATGPSLDQFIGQELARRGAITPKRSLLYGLHDRTGNWGPWYEGPGASVDPIFDPYLALADLIPTVGASGRDQVRRALTRKHFLLDRAVDDCRLLSRELGTEARARLETHCANLEALEAGVAASLASRPACTTPDAPATDLPEGTNFLGRETRDQAFRAFTELTALAFSCDITRVVGLSFGAAAARFAIPEVHGIPASGTVNSGDSGPQHHAWTHQPDSEEALQALGGFYRWYSSRVAELLDKLATTMDVDGRPLSETTLVLWTSELGWNDGGHPNRNIPILLFGNSDGAFRTDRMFDGGGTTESAAVVHQLFVSIIHHMGLTDVESFGNHGTGPLEWLAG
jgi:hypothetical protein